MCVGRAAGSGGVEHEKRLTVVDGDANQISDPNLLLAHKIAAQGDREEERGWITPFAEAVFQACSDSYGGFEETHGAMRVEFRPMTTITGQVSMSFSGIRPACGTNPARQHKEGCDQARHR